MDQIRFKIQWSPIAKKSLLSKGGIDDNTVQFYVHNVTQS